MLRLRLRLLEISFCLCFGLRWRGFRFGKGSDWDRRSFLFQDVRRCFLSFISAALLFLFGMRSLVLGAVSYQKVGRDTDSNDSPSSLDLD